MADHHPHPDPRTAPDQDRPLPDPRPAADDRPAPDGRSGPRLGTTRFPVNVDAALREAGWQPGRWDIKLAEEWADALRAHHSPAGHRHSVFPAAVEAWAEFGGLRLTAPGHGRQIAPATLRFDPLAGLHLARTLGDLGRALGTELAPLGEEGDHQAVLAMDVEGRVYSLDHAGDWYLGKDIDTALNTLVTGSRPVRLTMA